MKPIIFIGDSLARLRDFPEAARSQAGYQLREIQKGLDPGDWKPMRTVGPGVQEIRIREAAVPSGLSIWPVSATTWSSFTPSRRRPSRRRREILIWRGAG